MGKKYFDTKEGTLESSVLNVWAEAAKKSESMDKVNPKALKKDFDDRKDKDIDNDGDVDDSDEYLHNRRKTVAKAVKKEEVEEAYKPVKNNHYDVKVTVSDREVDKVKSFIMNSSEYNNGEIEDVDTDQVDGGGQAFKGKGDIFIQGDGAGSLGVDLQKNFGRKIKVMGEGVELDEKVKEYEGVAYFKDRKDAEAHMKKFAPKGRVVEYERGYAVQTRISGPYLNKSGKVEEQVEKKDVEESYEIGTDEYRDHTLEVTPGQSLTWGSANAYKQASMKEALAKVWGLDEKVLDKSEEDDKIAPVKGKKSMTGGKVADVDVDPEMKDEK